MHRSSTVTPSADRGSAAAHAISLPSTATPDAAAVATRARRATPCGRWSTGGTAAAIAIVGVLSGLSPEAVCGLGIGTEVP